MLPLEYSSVNVDFGGKGLILGMHTTRMVTMEQVDYKAFKEFLKDEMAKRGMSAREFAAFIGVTHTTINRFTSDDPPKKSIPSMDFLAKLCDKTHTDFSWLLGLVFPRIAHRLKIDPGIVRLAQQLSALPEPIRDVIKAILASQAGKSNGH
jgi:transcriptional regulator with XRE-family HTH domain